MKSRSSDLCDHLFHSTWQTTHWRDNGQSRLKKQLLTIFWKKYQRILHSLLAATVTSLLFLGGAYLFLVQLSEYGW